MNYSAINIQGNILSSEVLEKIRTEDMRYQTAKDFGLDPSTSVRDEISLAWSLALSHWKAFKQKRESLSPTDTGTTETRNYWMKPLMGILGFDLTAATAEIINGKTYAISFRAANLDNFPVHIVGINQSLDARAESGGPRLSPHALAQEYLNNQEHMYALVSNGKFLRLLRDATRLSRLSYLEFNLEQMMEESLYAEFALLYRALHASRMPQKIDAGAESILEFYHQEALASGSRIRERLSAAVETSIKELANGFLSHNQNETLRQAIAAQQLDAKDYYLYNLRIIYRLLFLMVIEERKLIFPAERNENLEQQRTIYYDYYSVQRLSRLVEKAVYVDPRKTDLWQSLVTCFALFEYSRYGAQLGIASLGSGLFASDALGIMGEQVLDNETVLKVLRYLVTFESETGQRVRVNYADLDVEEFGSVYEGLLEYEPQILEPATHPHFIFKKGSERSKSGSHYTPEELVKPLIQHSLDYLIQDKLTEADPEAALLSLKVCDVACGSGHILLSAARRIGFELAKLRSREDQPSPTVLRQAIRDVIHHCIYGVDKNPLAVELCKVAMWLEAHNPGQPLNFLDHHIKCGDAIVGVAHREELEKGIADEAFKSLFGDEKDVAVAFSKRNKAERKQKEQAMLDFNAAVKTEVEAIIEQYNLFKNLPERTPEEIVNKEKQYRQYEQDYHRIRLRQLADAHVAQFFISKTDGNKPYLLTDAEYRSFLRQVNKHMGILQSHKLAKSELIAKEKKFFHWFLEFPEVFKDGGFDCILGNPPFLGGQKLSGTFGENFLEYIKYQFAPIGAVDLVTYFFRRIFSIISKSGFQSLISTNTIAQGRAREDGLDIIVGNGGIINHAVKNRKWPGIAAVEVSLITITKQHWKGKVYLDEKETISITSYLDSAHNSGNPQPLKRNEGRSFQGSIILGKGFVLESNRAKELIQRNSKNKEVLFPYLNGDDLNNNPDQNPSRWVINFFDWPRTRYSKEDWSVLSGKEKQLIMERLNNKQTIEIAPPWFDGNVATDFPECYQILLDLVKDTRQLDNRKSYRDYWWQYAEKRSKLYRTITSMKKVLVSCRVSKYVNQSFIEVGSIFDVATSIVIRDKFWEYAYFQSSIHNHWAWKYGSTMKSDIRYTNKDCIDTFPIVEVTEELLNQLDEVGSCYHGHRYQLMHSMQLGLTKSYNAFHAPEIKLGITASALKGLDKNAIEKGCGKEVWNLWNHMQKTVGKCSIEEAIAGIVKLRDLHVQMDKAVLKAYGWSDIQLRHDFYEVDYLPENDRIRFTIHSDARKEVLKRLLELNHKIHAEEVAAGLWDKKEKKKMSTGAEEGVVMAEGEVDFGLFKQE